MPHGRSQWAETVMLGRSRRIISSSGVRGSVGYSSDTIPVRSPLRRVLVTGPSMAPAIRHGDQLLVDVRPERRPTHAGDVVVVRLPDRPLSVKRVGRVESDGSVWVEGDNSFGSTDSRDLGAVPREAVVGRILLRLWPHPGRLPPAQPRSAAD